MTGRPFHPATYAVQGLIALSNEVERELARRLRVNLTDYRALSVLSALSASGPVTIGGLASQLGATPATTTAIVNRLESQGYARRHRADADRRQVEVSLTARALQLIMSLMGPLMVATDEHIGSLPGEHRRVILEFFEVVKQQMRDQVTLLASTEEAL